MKWGGQNAPVLENSIRGTCQRRLPFKMRISVAWSLVDRGFFCVLLLQVKSLFIYPGVEGATSHLCSPFFISSGVYTLGYNYQLYLENCQHLSLRMEAIKWRYRSTTRCVWFNEGFLVAWQFMKFYDPKCIYLFTFLQLMQ